MSHLRLVLPALLLLGCGDASPPAASPPAASPPIGSAEPTAAASAAPSADANEPASYTPDPELVSGRALEVVTAADRSEADRALDAGRKPGEMLAFYRIAEGMKVAELGAGTGYTAELLARMVGPSGRVYGQNSKFILERFAEGPWTERLNKPVMKPVVRVDREFDDPLPPEASNLDAVFLVMFYHDSVWMKTDRDAMNKHIFAALKKGGTFAVVDHSARQGDGLKVVKTLHRIEESVLRAEVEKAGFKLDREASFLRNPDDARDWSASPSQAGERRGTSDRFVLSFVKP